MYAGAIPTPLGSSQHFPDYLAGYEWHDLGEEKVK